jgi:hypothetical protein
MYDAVLMSVGQRRRRLTKIVERGRHIETLRTVQKLPQTGPLDIGHREEAEAVTLIDGEDGNDVRMIQLGCGTRFLLEAADDLRILAEERREDLEGDVPIEGDLIGEIDARHAAVAEIADDLELAAGRSAQAPEQLGLER